MTTLTWLDADAVRELLPSITEQIDVVAETYVAAANGRVELPPKPSLHPRADGFLNAMPAWLMDSDVVAMKWIGVYPSNRVHGRPTSSALIVVNDPDTGEPTLIMDAAGVTTARTTAATGAAIRHLAHPGWRRVAILGFGELGRAHAQVVQVLEPAAEVVAWSPRLVSPGQVAGVQVAAGAREAVEGADVVITCGPMPRERDPVVERAWLADRCLVLPVDYDARVRADVTQAADLFVVDDVPQFESFVAQGSFRDWAEPHGSLGEALQREPDGDLRVVCSLGVGSLDAAMAGVVRDRNRDAGLGVRLRG